METTLAIIAGIAVLGLIVLGVVLVILSAREREGLYKLIKSKDLVEYVSVTEEPDEEEESLVTEVPIDEIPILEESRE